MRQSLELRRNYDPEWVEPLRQSLGYTLHYAERMNLIDMIPADDVASSTYCLANNGKEYLVYLAEKNNVTINLKETHGVFEVEWFNPNTGDYQHGENINGGEHLTLHSPFGSDDAVLYIFK